jgi:FkbM family methyltransferase
MNTLEQRIKWSPNFIKTFGLIQGLLLLRQIVRNLPRNASEIKGYDVPGYGAKIFLRRTIADHATFKQCLVTNQYNFLDLPQAERLLQSYRNTLKKGERPLIIDGGANIGLATLWFARHFPEARIVAVEPDDANFRILQQNTRHLGERVTLIQGGVWHRNARLGILNPDSGAAAFRVGELPEGSIAGVPAFSIDDICSRMGTPSPLIVKLDIEGSQAHLFSANTGWVGRTDLITLELDDWLLPWQGTSRSFFRCLSQYPFDYLLHKESIFCFRDTQATAPVTAD